MKRKRQQWSLGYLKMYGAKVLNGKRLINIEPWSVHVMEYQSAIKRNEVIHAANIPSERGQTQNVTYYRIPFL